MRKIWKIGLAVSGGADSTALAVLMAKLQEEHAFKAVVLHVDHSLRPDSALDARFVRQLAKTLKLPFHGIRVNVTRNRGESLEMAARRERLAFFERMTTKLGLDAIATGHHADDVAETFLMRLARGSGPDGLAGLKRISHVNGITFIRPLLDLRDADLKVFLSQRGLSWREDSTNTDTSILRNRVRHLVLPFLRANLDERISEHICKTAAILRGELTLPAPSTIPVPKAIPSPVPNYTLAITPAIGYERRPAAIGKLPTTAFLSQRALAGRTLELRPWQPGDRIAPTGMNGQSRKLQDVYVTAKTPPDIRRSLPILADCDTGEILWLPGYRVASSAAVESATAPSWQLTLSR